MFLRLVCVLFLVITLTASSGCERTSPEELVAKAEQAYAERNFANAIVHLKNVLQQQPDSARARWLLSEIYLDIEDGASAEKELERAKRLGVSEDAVLPSMAKALLLQRKDGNVLILQPERPISPAAAAEIAASKAVAALRGDDMEAARAYLSDSLSRSPASTYVLYSQAVFLAETEDTAGALGVLEQVVRQVPTYAPAWTLRGDLLRDQGKYEDAAGAYTQAINFRFSPAKDQVRRGLVRLAMRDLDGARTDADQAVARAPKLPEANYLSGTIAFYDKDYEKAREFLERSYTADQNHFQTTVLLAATDFRLGNYERATRLAESAVASRQDYIPARKLLCGLYIRDGKAQRAESLIRPVVAARPDDIDAKDLLATSLILQGKGAEASPLLTEIAAKREDSAMAQLRSGLGLLQAGEVEKGIGSLERALELSPDDALVNRALVAELVKQEAMSDAIAAAQRYVASNPGKAEPLSLLANAYLAHGDKDKAAETFALLLEAEPGNVVASRTLAAIAESSGDLVGARKYLEDAYRLEANDVGLLLQLAHLAEMEGDSQQVEQWLEKASQADPSVAVPRVLLARKLLDVDRPEKALTMMAGVDARADPIALRTKADIYVRLGQYSDAIAELEALANYVPNSAEVQFQLAQLYELTGNFPSLRQALNRALAIDPMNRRAKIAKAKLLAVDGDVDGATRLLDAVESSEDDLELIAARMLVARQASDFGAEVRYARILQERQPSSSGVIALSRAHERNQRTDDAVAVLSQWLSTHPEDASVLFQLAGVYHRMSNESAMVDALKRVLSLDPTNVAVLNNLAWATRKHDPDKARELSRRAFDLSSSNLAVLDTYSTILMEAGDYDLALKVIDRAIEVSEPADTYRLRKAQVLLMSGDRSTAAEIIGTVNRESLSGDDKKARDELVAQLEK